MRLLRQLRDQLGIIECRYSCMAKRDSMLQRPVASRYGSPSTPSQGKSRPRPHPRLVARGQSPIGQRTRAAPGHVNHQQPVIRFAGGSADDGVHP
jgi:hypothetical protein